MKKLSIIIFILACLLLFGIFIVKADLIDSVDSNIQKVEDTKSKIEDIQNTKWDYLGKEWKAIFLKNKIIFGIDSFLTKISIIFKILIYEPYSLSLRFFIILILWLFVFFNLSRLLGESFFEGGVSYIVGFVITIILAYFGAFKLFYSFLVGIVNLFSGGVVYLIILLYFLSLLFCRF